jgi:hypothetical protein
VRRASPAASRRRIWIICSRRIKKPKPPDER